MAEMALELIVGGVKGAVKGITGVKDKKEDEKKLELQKDLQDQRLAMEKEAHDIKMEMEKIQLSMKKIELEKMKQGPQEKAELQKLAIQKHTMELEMEKLRVDGEREVKRLQEQLEQRQDQNDSPDGQQQTNLYLTAVEHHNDSPEGRQQVVPEQGVKLKKRKDQNVSQDGQQQVVPEQGAKLKRERASRKTTKRRSIDQNDTPNGQQQKSVDQKDTPDGYEAISETVLEQKKRSEVQAVNRKPEQNVTQEECSNQDSNSDSDTSVDSVIENKDFQKASALSEMEKQIIQLDTSEILDTRVEISNRPAAEVKAKYNPLEDTQVEMKKRNEVEEKKQRILTEAEEKKRISEQLGREMYDASKVGDIKKVLEAIGKGGNINFQKPPSGLTPLYWASARGHLPIVQALLQGCANTAVKDQAGWTALRAARAWGHTEVVDELLNYGAEE